MSLVTTAQPVVSTEVAPLGASAHDQAMLAKVDAANAAHASTQTPATPATRPEHIPEKFWDAEKGVARVDELAKSYAELEKLRAAPQKAPEAAKPADPAQPLDDAAKAAAEAAKAAGADTSKLDIQSISAEYAEKGELSSEAYGKLEAAGLSRDMVDAYIAGQAAILSGQVAEAYSMAGGQEQYTVMLDWATQNLPPAEQAAFDRAVVSDPATRKQAITALKAQYSAAVGTTPQLLSGKQGSSAVGIYNSRAEVTADMSNPLYRKDPAFRAKVEAKLAASSVF